MPVKTTYYSDDEMAFLEEREAQGDESFSGLVRAALQDYYDEL